MTFGCLWLVNFKNQKKKFCTPRSLSPTLHTPLQCTLPRTFTYRACPFSVHCLSFQALASWDSNPIPWYLKTSALSTTPQSHWCDSSKFGYINTREWSRQNRFQGQIAVDGEIATALKERQCTPKGQGRYVNVRAVYTGRECIGWGIETWGAKFL